MYDAFVEELSSILRKYRADSEEALDGDEVDRLVGHLRNKLNLLEGNITDDEYLELQKRI